MKVRMLSTYANEKCIVDPGKVIDLPAAEARQIIDGGFGRDVGDNDPKSTMPVRSRRS